MTDLISGEYLGDSISVGFHPTTRMFCLVKAFSDGSFKVIELDPHVRTNLLEYLIDRGFLEIQVSSSGAEMAYEKEGIIE